MPCGISRLLHNQIIFIHMKSLRIPICEAYCTYASTSNATAPVEKNKTAQNVVKISQPSSVNKTQKVEFVGEMSVSREKRSRVRRTPRRLKNSLKMS